MSAWMDALRVRQWHKNALVFIPYVFAFRLVRGDASEAWRVVQLFLAFCAVSSAVYLLNDVLDRDSDRAHPLKRHRAIASGRVSLGAALGAAALLTVLGLGFAFRQLPLPAFGVLVGYLAMQCAYCGGLRATAAADVIVIALGFVLRAVAGALAIDVVFSEWLLVCTFFGALRVALGKRQAELAAGRTGLRRSWESVSDSQLASFGVLASSVLVIAYTLYCFSSATAHVIGATAVFPPLLVTLPFVAFGVMRYELIAGEGKAGEPETLPLRDRPLASAIVAWFLVSFSALYLWRHA